MEPPHDLAALIDGYLGHGAGELGVGVLIRSMLDVVSNGVRGSMPMLLASVMRSVSAVFSAATRLLMESATAAWACTTSDGRPVPAW